MKKLEALTLFILTAALAGIAALVIAGCGNSNNGLAITAVPTQPFLIPYGSGVTVDNGYFSLTAPYFTLTALNVSWTGTGKLNIVGILLSTQAGATETVNCGFGGDDLNQLFPQNVNSSSQVLLASGTTVSSSEFGCGGVGIPNPIPTTFDIPVSIQVIGAILDDNNNTTGRAESTTSITIE